MEEIKSSNIPAMSVGELVNSLSELYSRAINAKMALKTLPTPFLWGAPGVGKSEGVKQLAEKLSESTKKKVAVTDVRLLLFSPVDLRGVPIADSERRFTDWLRPRVFDMDPSENMFNILFLDELSAAPQSVQAAAYQICLDRRVGEHVLPENCIVIAAGNRTTDKSVAFKMPKALCNRLMHFEIRPDYESWKSWAVANGIDGRVIGYLGFDNSKLCVEPNANDNAYPTPRSWAFVSTILKTMNCEPRDIHQLISAAIGADTALELEAWCKNSSGLPDVNDILSGSCTFYPKTNDLLYTLCQSLTAAVANADDTITSEQLENICAYVSRMPEDFAFAFFKDINSMNGLKLKLMKCQSLQLWLRNNKKYL